MKEVLRSIVNITKEAGREILRIYENVDFEISYKNDNSPLTAADKASNDLIKERLKELCPDIPILSEESERIPYEERKNWHRFWLVDPLDGTKEFISRNGEFTVNIALIEDGAPALGCMGIPVEGKIYYGIRNGDAFKVDERGERTMLKIGKTDIKKRAVAVVSRSHLSENTVTFLDKLGCDRRSAGSALKFIDVAEGKAHIYPRLGPTWEWDTGAGHAIAEACGAEVYDLKGAPLLYDKENLKHNGFVVSAPEMKSRVVEILSRLMF